MKLNQILPKYLLTEDKISYISQHMGDRLVAAAKKDEQIKETNPIQILQQLAKGDPTPNNKYLQWIANVFSKGKLKYEDIGRVHTSLKKILSDRLQVGDINQYKSIHDLEDKIDGLEPVKSKRQEKQEIKTEGADVILKSNEGTILKLKTVEAACYYGKGTKWCTGADMNNMFDNYNHKGPLYVFITNDNIKYQFHFELRQFMDSRDRPIDIMELRERYKIVDEFFKIKEKEIAKDVKMAYEYAIHVIKGRFPEGEDAISKNVEYSYRYASYINRRFPEGEDAISKNVEYSYRYAKDIIKGRFPEGEDAISKNAMYSYGYANFVIKGRFPEGEDVISKNAQYSYQYAKHVIKGKFPEGEDVISKNVEYSYQYAKDIIKGRFPEGEDAISKNARYSYVYAKEIIKGRFPEGEKEILSYPHYKDAYEKLLKST